MQTIVYKYPVIAKIFFSLIGATIFLFLPVALNGMISAYTLVEEESCDVELFSTIAPQNPADYEPNDDNFQQLDIEFIRPNGDTEIRRYYSNVFSVI